MHFRHLALALFAAIVFVFAFTDLGLANEANTRPNIVLVMADDQGWAQTGYYNHPVLKTPNLDAMAGNGLRFDRFYAGAPVCSPTRASVLTGRANDRTGVPSHGHALRRQEITLPNYLRQAGYATGHFGKWHLNGLRGPGVPILASDDHNPGHFGFDKWISVTNFFDRDPIMSRMGKFEEHTGDSSEIIVDLALAFIKARAQADQPSFSVIWYGTPHHPFKATEEDMRGFERLDPSSANHYGELVAMDRSIGTLRKGLREAGIADNTIIWFCSDNGGLPKINPSSVGQLRGNKGTVYEGGLRVPGIVEWPAVIKPRITSYPAGVVDMLPTILDITGIELKDQRPIDGLSLRKLFAAEIGDRPTPLTFRFQGRGAIIDNRYKVVANRIKNKKFEMFDLVDDVSESTNIANAHPKRFAKLRDQLVAWHTTVEASVNGLDYPEGKVNDDEPTPRFWTEVDEYKPYFEQWQHRWEYESRLKPSKKTK